MEEIQIFVLKDQDGNYVSANSISYDSESKQVIYSYCKTLTNGFYNCSSFDDVQTLLDKLNQSQKRFKLEKEFHIEEIPMVATYKEEDRLGLDSRFPFKHEYIDFDDNERWIWVLKNSKGNLAPANSVKKWDSKTLMYVTFKTFSPECRGYIDLMSAEKALTKLYSKIRDMGLKEKFTLNYVNIDDAINQHELFKGENMILLEKSVVKIVKKRSA